jgi:AraC family transcriptional regulator
MSAGCAWSGPPHLAAIYRLKSGCLEIALDSGLRISTKGGAVPAGLFPRRSFGVTPSEYQSLELPPSTDQGTTMTAVTPSTSDVRIETAFSASDRLHPRCWSPIHRKLSDRPSVGLGNVLQRPRRVQPQHTMHRRLLRRPRSDRPGKTAGRRRHHHSRIIQTQAAMSTYKFWQVVPTPYCDTKARMTPWICLTLDLQCWLPDSGREPANAPPYEVYLNDARTTPPEELLTEICIHART